MGLKLATKFDGKYLEFRDGFLTERAESALEGTTERQYTDRNTGEVKSIYEWQYSELSGYLMDVKLITREFEDKNIPKQFSYRLYIEDEGQMYMVSFSCMRPQWKSVMLRLLFWKDEDWVTIKAGKSKGDDGNYRAWATVLLNDEKLKPKYGRETNPPLPEATKSVSRGGETKWDFGEQDAFIDRVIEEELIPRLPGLRKNNESSNSQPSATSPEKVKEPVENTVPDTVPPPFSPPVAAPDNEDDLPF